MPILKNVMINFFGCSMTVFGDKSKYCLTYKENQPSFYQLSKKYTHDFKVYVSDQNFEKAFGLSVDSIDQFLVANNEAVFVFDEETYQMRYKIDLDLP